MARPSPFVDLAREARPFTKFDGTAAPVDRNGWPLSDGQVVLFDERPVKAWAPPADDPALFQPDMSGAYQLSFTGQAVVTNAGPASITISDEHYDRAANRTTFRATLPKGSPSMLCLRFSRTRRTAHDKEGSGITELRCIRPGYSPATTQIFDTAFLDALRPFAYLRFMTWLGTTRAAAPKIEWADRALPSDAVQGFAALRPGARGIAWEYVVALANTLGKDIWINVPADATGENPKDQASYVYQLAALLKRDLNPGISIYVEYSNELWYDRFPAYAWNRQAAAAEVARGGSTLNSDGSRGLNVWARRREAKRLYEITKIFDAVFGGPARIRPVFAWWFLKPAEFRDVLAWMNRTYGPPKTYFWAIAQSDYFDDAGAGASSTVPAILSIMRANSDAGVTYTRRIDAIAREFGLRHTCYEGGPDNGGSSNANLASRIAANRTPEMAALMERHIGRNWFPHGPASFTYFSLSSPYAAFGSYGATEDYRLAATPKFKAVVSLATEPRPRR